MNNSKYNKQPNQPIAESIPFFIYVSYADKA